VYWLVLAESTPYRATMAFLATILKISRVTQYSLCAYQRLFINGE